MAVAQAEAARHPLVRLLEGKGLLFSHTTPAIHALTPTSLPLNSDWQYPTTW
jgi:hypothetical protein